MSENSAGGGIGFFGLLGIVFITLKLTGVINWSWWWVTAPLWGGWIVVLGFLAVFFLIGMGLAGVVWLLETMFK